jgi:anti-sigma factor RsiW
MPACDQVRLLLGPFDDGELEPHEMEDVALHVVSCTACKAALEDYRSLGVALRDCTHQPSVDGFTNAVLKRIGEVPQPLRLRMRRQLDSLAEYLGGGVALVAAGAFAALVTVWIVTPHARLLPDHQVSGGGGVPVASSASHQEAVASPGEFVTPQAVPGFGRPNAFSGGERTVSDPNAVPATNEAPLIAVSNDPATTVIWVPSQP